jgi:hypothetical protein
MAGFNPITEGHSSKTSATADEPAVPRRLRLAKIPSKYKRESILLNLAAASECLSEQELGEAFALAPVEHR